MPRKKHRQQPFPEEDPVFQIAPMIDVLLQILVFFMAITTVEVMRTNKDVKLPIAENGQPEKSKKDISIINIVWKGDNEPPSVDIDNAPAGEDLGTIVRRLDEATKVNPEHRAIIRADRGTQYLFVQKVMKACADGNCMRVAFAVVNQEELGSQSVAAVK